MRIVEDAEIARCSRGLVGKMSVRSKMSFPARDAEKFDLVRQKPNQKKKPSQTLPNPLDTMLFHQKDAFVDLTNLGYRV